MPHITKLADEHCIMMINPYDLKNAVDASTDLRHDLGDTMENDFTVLLIEKEKECTGWFHDDLRLLGIQEPITIIIMDDGSWQMDDGHNRLRWALLNNIEVPVVFDDTGAGEDSELRYEVQREDVEAYHYTERAEHNDTVKIDSALIGKLIPFPRTGEQHAVTTSEDTREPVAI